MKVYLAASFSRQAELRSLAAELSELGIEVTSRWLQESEAPNPQDRDRQRRERAFDDVSDVRAADILVRFTDEFVRLDGDPAVLNGKLIRAHLATGARMFEMGLAWSEGIPIVVVGGYQCIFDYLPNVVHLPNTDELKKFLKLRG